METELAVNNDKMAQISWDKNYKQILVYIAILITVFVGMFEIFVGPDLTAYEKLNLLAISYTALIIAWYSKETYDLKQQGRKSLLSSIQPIIVAYQATPYLVLKNSGRGIAKKLEWETISGNINVLSVPAAFSGILEPFHDVIGNLKNVSGGSLIAYKLVYNGDGTIRVRYENDRNGKYYSDIRVGPGITILLKTGSIRELK